MSKLTRLDPFKGVSLFPRWIDELEDTFQSQRGLKIQETAESIIAEAVVAGVPADDVEVTIEDGVMTIKAIKKEDEKTEDGYRSSSYQYYYTAALSGGQWDEAKAEIEHGVVHITIPKAKAARPQRVEVTAKTKKK